MKAIKWLKLDFHCWITCVKYIVVSLFLLEIRETVDVLIQVLKQ